MEIKTWKDLMEFGNSLSEEQLNKPVIWWGDERGGRIVSARALEEDYVNESGEGVEPISAYANDPEYKIDELEVVISKGEPILFDNISLLFIKCSSCDKDFDVEIKEVSDSNCLCPECL